MLVAVDDTELGNAELQRHDVQQQDPRPDLTASFMPQTNQVLQIVTNLGAMDFQLFNNDTPNTVAHFVSLVNSGTYTNTTFYRIIESFMDQGGVTARLGQLDPRGVERPSCDSHPAACWPWPTTAWTATVRNSSSPTPNDMSDGFLDFRYTIFGKLISGDNVRQAIAATPVTTNTSTHEDSQPLTAPKIESMSIVTETSDSVLMLQARDGSDGHLHGHRVRRPGRHAELHDQRRHELPTIRRTPGSSRSTARTRSPRRKTRR